MPDGHAVMVDAKCLATGMMPVWIQHRSLVQACLFVQIDAISRYRCDTLDYAVATVEETGVAVSCAVCMVYMALLSYGVWSASQRCRQINIAP